MLYFWRVIPEAFAAQCRLLFPSQADALLQSLETEGPVSIRINLAKNPGIPMGSQPVSWSAQSWYLDKRPSFIADPLWHAGTYYVQEASSLFLEQVWNFLLPQFEHPYVLDACAAPGGKTTHLLNALRGKGFLLANEVIQSRAKILCENLTRWGADNVAVSNNDPSKISGLKEFFHIILADVPCSGEGMFRKDHDARAEWSPEHVQLCAQRQQRILNDLLPALAPGGYLVYSTCTFNQQENEQQLEWLVKEQGLLPVATDFKGPEVTETVGIKAYRFFPHQLDGEGFFFAVLQKPGNKEATQPSRNTKTIKEMQGLPDWIGKQDLQWFMGREDLFVLNGIEEHDWMRLQKELRIVKSGVRVGHFKHSDFIPHHELAYAGFLQDPPRAILDLNQALRYLKREDPGLTQGEKGLQLASYKGFGLGWLKHLGNRSNNQLPMDWRILMPLDQLQTPNLFGL